MVKIRVRGVPCLGCGRIDKQIIAIRRCDRCYRAHRDFGPRSVCARCCRSRPLWDGTGMCSACIHFVARKAKSCPERLCGQCGLTGRIASGDLCHNCYQRDGARIAVWMSNKSAARVLPDWFVEFAAFVEERFGAAHGLSILRPVHTALIDTGPSTERAVRDRLASYPNIEAAAVRAFEAFLVEHGKLFAVDHRMEMAPSRRAFRIDGVPAKWRREVALFGVAMIEHRDRAKRRGTRQVGDRRIEERLATLRNFARWCVTNHPELSWWLVSTCHIEAFVSAVPRTRTIQLSAMRAFYRWALRQRFVIVDPTAAIKIVFFHPHTPIVLSDDLAKGLFRRWTTDLDVHPHESFIGLMTMLHGASSNELRTLTIGRIDLRARSVRLGTRPGWTVLDPFCWAAIERVLSYHQKRVGALNTHILASGWVRTHTGPPCQSALTKHFGALGLGVTLRNLRSAHLVSFVEDYDVALVAAAHAMIPKGALYYRSDRIDNSRIIELGIVTETRPSVHVSTAKPGGRPARTPKP